ncbi:MULTISPECIES: hypothetical protein [Enterobacter cloacae complex]|uniref:Uncharacterized protein n=1 Tax=Enterobacter cloacae TaxID=550 RepID=A0A330G6M8_ENTCL|nr:MULTISPECIES: hypothetical protein [Enterobacter cloacae complex]MBT1933215.1 hypothetical protein [Enterobacter chengduensis]MBT1964906.1 hypothetical protein [Enterobacter chengduensis]MCK7168321.1 hypothetical protein [Enterobacter chengduensis]MCM7673891.1 hypothetical protein [Enterobacter chengduensis]MCM8030096.1 hypothetical protein [Enterobacter chengduensis]
MVKARLFGNVFIDNGVGIKASGDVDIESHGSIFQGNGKAMELDSGVPEEVLAFFKQGVNIQKLRLLIEETQKKEDPKPETLARKLKKSGLSAWIANGANTVTVATAIIECIKFISR